MSNLSRRRFELAMMGTLGVKPALALAETTQAAQNVQPQPDQPGSGKITDVEGIRVGHFTDPRRPTGCTAILFDEEASAGVDYDGSAPGDQLGVMLQPASPVETIHGLLLTGGGPFGLAAVPGVVRYLEEHQVGFDWGASIRVPIVVGAVIDDLMLGDAKIRPDPEAAYRACAAASTGPVEEGNVGAGSGATVGKMLRSHGLPGMKSGIGTASVRVGGVTIGALAVVNAAGDIVDWRRGEIVAGARTADGKAFANIVETLKRTAGLPPQQAIRVDDAPFHSTTLIVVATNAAFTKTELTKIAMMASTGAARVINPYHTTGDGDSTFALSTNRLKSEIGITAVGTLAADVVSHAVLSAVGAARSVEGWMARRDLRKEP